MAGMFSPTEVENIPSPPAGACGICVQEQAEQGEMAWGFFRTGQALGQDIHWRGW